MAEVTAITTATQSKTSDGNYYDLQGRKVNKNAKGLRIQDGKKVVK
jgi:hypothetical protein